MKVMLLTLQEEPPLCDIYKDDSYKFSKNYHSMISKCLRKDAKKRPSAKKLLEHKFFKIAQDNSYIYHHLVSKVQQANQHNDSTADRPHVCREKTIIDKAKVEKSKPVSVGSWVFDKQDFEQFKQSNAESIAVERQQLGQVPTHDHAASSEDEQHHTNEQVGRFAVSNDGKQKESQRKALPVHTAEESAEFEQQNAELSMQQRLDLQKQLEQVEQQVGRFKIQES